MLYTKLTHPAILGALAATGHGSRVLITDGNYPLSTQTPPGAERVYLNLQPWPGQSDRYSGSSVDGHSYRGGPCDGS